MESSLLKRTFRCLQTWRQALLICAFAVFQEIKIVIPRSRCHGGRPSGAHCRRSGGKREVARRYWECRPLRPMTSGGRLSMHRQMCLNGRTCTLSFRRSECVVSGLYRDGRCSMCVSAQSKHCNERTMLAEPSRNRGALLFDRTPSRRSKVDQVASPNLTTATTRDPHHGRPNTHFESGAG
jgi:hypothetical protein